MKTGADFQQSSSDDVADEPFKVWTHDEAEALRIKEPQISLWRVVGTQALAGLLIAAVWWIVSGKFEGAASALYGAAAITLPQALMARGLGRLKNTGPGGMVAGFMFWQFVKIGFAVLMLVGAGVGLKWIVWPAVLVAMVVCTKMNWLALLMRGRSARKMHAAAGQAGAHKKAQEDTQTTTLGTRH